MPSLEADTEIVKVTDDIEGVVDNSLFVCIKGEKTDGHRFAAEALRRGAAAVVCQEHVDGPAVYTENTRLAFSKLSAAFYGHPDRKLRLIGITGTNGKTTTAVYIQSILEQCGYKTARIGTLGSTDGDIVSETGYTTPKSDLFFSTLASAVKNGCAFCVTEVSSQALAQYRVHGATFSLGVCTNIGTDHLDYHKTVENLVAAKTRLCSLSRQFLVNADDAYAGAFLSACEGRAFTCSARGNPADFFARRQKFLRDAAEYTFCFRDDAGRVRTPVPGEFSVYNSLTAAAACIISDLPFQKAVRAANRLPLLPGRMQTVHKNGVRVCVDFAHTPAALEAALCALRTEKTGRLFVVFGCGGDRDKTKRPLMGALAQCLADTVILTSDNPRSEAPETIIREILAGMENPRAVITEPDRKAAILLALQRACPGDTVLIAGKGHEACQIIGETKRPFNDLEVVLGIRE